MDSEPAKQVEPDRAPSVVVALADAHATHAAVTAIDAHFGGGTATVVQPADLPDSPARADATAVVIDHGALTREGISLLDALTADAPDLPVIVVAPVGARVDLVSIIQCGAADLIRATAGFDAELPARIQQQIILACRRDQAAQRTLRMQALLGESRLRTRRLEEQVAMLTRAAATDPLTGLANRRAFNESLGRAIARAGRDPAPVACIMLDLDRFKEVNDQLGHQAGDDVLQLVAQVLSTVCRRTDVAGRFGGDEFVVLLPNADEERARVVAGRIVQAFADETRRLFDELHTEVDVTLSMGAACVPAGVPITADELIAQADHALYRAKTLPDVSLIIEAARRTAADTSATPKAFPSLYPAQHSA